MDVAPYLSFRGDCEKAFTLYVATLGGKIGEMFRYGGSPMAAEAPPDWGDRVMHGSATVGGMLLMGADMVPAHYTKPAGFSISVHLATAAEAERVFAALSEGGEVQMPIAQTFWAERFGMCVDRFGIPWTVNGGQL